MPTRCKHGLIQGFLPAQHTIQNLNLPLWLHQPTHYTQAHIKTAFTCSRTRYHGVIGAVRWRSAVAMPRVGKTKTAVLQHEVPFWHHKARAKALKNTGHQGNC